MLQKKQALYRDLIPIPVQENKDPFSSLDTAGILYGYQKKNRDMEPILRGQMLLRTPVIKRLQQAQVILQRKKPDYALYVTYGYRSLQVQTSRFQNQIVREIRKKFFPDPILLYEKAHCFTAMPIVAGHPTGGAIDVTLWDKKNQRLAPMGSTLYDYTSSLCEVWNPDINQEDRKQRMILRTCMMQAGFAPFDGEYWHFSFGDKEWASYYKKPAALYRQFPLENVLSSLASF